VQLITGDLDPGAPLARMHETILQWYPRAEFHRLTGVGHYPMREEPRALHALIEPRLLDSVQ
jgi:pimeloyl-ACP methyl ester carboxylesterase